MKRTICCLIISFLASVWGSIGCASPAPTAPVVPGTQQTEVLPKSTKNPSEDWERTIAEARKEGQVTIYKATIKFDRAAAKFKEEYGITVDPLTLNSSQIAQRMSREYSAGLYNVDVISTGSGGVRLLVPMGLLDPLDNTVVLPEVLDPDKWVGRKFPLVDHYEIDFVGRVASTVWRNTEMVGESEISQMRDLLNPKWKGKIIFDDPQNRGSGTLWFRTYYPILGDDYMKALIRQEPMVLRDKRLEVEWLARGKYSILLGGNAENLVEFRKAGAPIQAVETQEGEYIGPGSGMIELAARPSHPNAARLFINWFLSKQGQTIMSEENLLPSLRVDVPSAHLDPDVVPKPGKVYLGDTPEVLAKAEEYLELSAKIFAPMLGSR